MDLDFGKKLLQQKKFLEALNFFLNEIEKGNTDIKLYFLLGLLYFKLNQIENSIYYYKLALKVDAKSINIIINLANSYYVIGKYKNAKNLYLDAIKINEHDPRPYYGLYLINNNNLSEDQIPILNEIKNKNNSSNNNYLVEYLLSRIAKKNNKLSFELNHLKNFQKQSFELRKDFNIQGLFYYNKIISFHYNKINFINYKKEDNKLVNINPIFIIGLPRSGSTLIESCISSSDKKIKSLGETSIINIELINELKNTIFKKDLEYEKIILQLDIQKFKNKIFNVYENFIKFDTNELFFTDKSLENFFNIEVILKIFPKAKFIHTNRDCADNVIAIYQSMLPELPWAHSISDILNYIDNYLKIMKYFKTKYPERILTVDLKKFTEDKENCTKEIFSFCKLKWSPAVLNFHENKNLVVKTLSSNQIREKTFKYNNNKYQQYKILLDKFRSKYSWLK